MPLRRRSTPGAQGASVTGDGVVAKGQIMPYPQRSSIEEIIAAYKETGTVWSAAKKLGICGQSVWERLHAIDYPMPNRKWTQAEIDELEILSSTCTLSEASQRLGRPYAAVASMMSKKGFCKRWGNRGARTFRRGTGFNARTMPEHTRSLEVFGGSLRQFCRANGFGLDLFVQALQKYSPDFWARYSKSRGLAATTCGYCGAQYYPVTKKQKGCSRLCVAAQKRDEQYFGGKRRNTVGLAEGVCQLCQQQKSKLSAHHLMGKENDPDNASLIALCAGCHQIVGILAGRKFADLNQGWEMLISLVMMRRLANHHSDKIGLTAHVELEWMTREDLEEEEHIRKDYAADGIERVEIAVRNIAEAQNAA